MYLYISRKCGARMCVCVEQYLFIYEYKIYPLFSLLDRAGLKCLAADKKIVQNYAEIMTEMVERGR